jgi:hypothetical protein
MDCGAIGVAMSPRTACSEDSHHALHISPKPALVREAVLVRDQASGVCRVSKVRWVFPHRAKGERQAPLSFWRGRLPGLGSQSREKTKHVKQNMYRSLAAPSCLVGNSTT